MKRTEYFATIEEANQYYPDGVVPSGVIAIVGDGSQVLVSSDNAATNTQRYFNADLTNDDIVSEMVQTSYSEGFTYGESVTYPVAYAAGQSYGEEIGYISGYTGGQAYGEEIGYISGYTGGYAYGYDIGYAAGESQGGSSGITSNDFLGYIVNNTITAGYYSFVISDNTPDASVLTDAFQAADSGLGVVYKASGDTLSTLPLYNPYDAEVGSQSELVYNDSVDENSYYDWMASAPISLQVGDMLGFVVGAQYNPLWIAPFDGSEPFVCETAGNYTVLMTSTTDDETGDVVWNFHIVPSTQLSGDYSSITNLNAMTMPISSGD